MIWILLLVLVLIVILMGWVLVLRRSPDVYRAAAHAEMQMHRTRRSMQVFHYKRDLRSQLMRARREIRHEFDRVEE